MSETRFPPLTQDQMTDEQRTVVDAIQSGPRGAGLRGPFNALVRSPALCDLVQRVGARLLNMSLWTSSGKHLVSRSIAPEP
jgi:4-carboxymuconolactone decarboxylase